MVSIQPRPTLYIYQIKSSKAQIHPPSSLVIIHTEFFTCEKVVRNYFLLMLGTAKVGCQLHRSIMLL